MTRQLRVEIAAATAFWGSVSLLYTFQIWWLARQLGERGQPVASILWTGSFYLYWIPLTVLVWRLTEGWTPGLLGWPRYLARHLALGSVVALAHNAVVTEGTVLIFAPPREGFWQMFPGALRTRSSTELILYAGVVASGQALWMYDRWRDRDAQAARLAAEAARLEAQLSAAKLNALEAQIQPHFLFNSLHTIASLARDGRNADVVRLIADLSELLRVVTDRQQSTRPLADEIALARRYLDIQQVRFGDRVRVNIDVDPAAERVSVPTLTLQPLVDNAIRHGIGDVVRGGTISIRAACDASSLTLIVEDDGPGTLAPGKGTGLANLRSRLEILYGDRGHLDAGPGPNGGFRVTVRVPRTDA